MNCDESYAVMIRRSACDARSARVSDRGDPKCGQDRWLIEGVGPAPPGKHGSQVGIRDEPVAGLELPPRDGVQAAQALEDRPFRLRAERRRWKRRLAGPATEFGGLE